MIEYQTAKKDGGSGGLDISDIKYIEYDSVDSTNSEARRLMQCGKLKPPAVLTAKVQTAGRGRQGRSFYSPADTGIYMSIVTELPGDVDDIQLLTVRVSLAVYDAIYDVTGIKTGIKWVNDLYLDHKKVCGILTEIVYCEAIDNNAAIIGIGINISTEDFPDELSDKAGSLGIYGMHIERLKEAILKKTTEYILDTGTRYPDARKLIETYKERSIVIGNKVSYAKNGIAVEGTAVGIDEKGALIVELNDGFDHLRSGEISLRTWSQE